MVPQLPMLGVRAELPRALTTLAGTRPSAPAPLHRRARLVIHRITPLYYLWSYLRNYQKGYLYRSGAIYRAPRGSFIDGSALGRGDLSSASRGDLTWTNWAVHRLVQG